MRKSLLTSLLAVTAFFPAFSQRNLGVATSNWSGLEGLYLNPANIADNRDRFVISIIGANIAVDNNLGKINANPGIGRFIKGGENNINDVFSFSSKNTFSLMAPYVDVHGPSVMVKIANHHSIAFTTRVRGVNELNNFDKSLYRSITDSAYARSGNLDLVGSKFNWTAHLWAEAAVSYGGVVLEKGRSELKVGATARYLSGIGFLGLKGNHLDAHFVTNSDSFYARNTDLEYSSNLLSTNSALTSGVSAGNVFDHIFNGKGGTGVGADIGVIYDYIEDKNEEKYDMDGKTGLSDQSKNRYKFRVSAAITDLGFIRYPSQNNFGLNVSGNGYITGQGFTNNVKDFNDFSTYAKQQGFHADTQKAAQNVYMPASLNIGFDYHACHNFYINAHWFENLLHGNNFGDILYSQISVTPRYDTKKYSIGIPVTYSMLTEGMKVGLGLRYTGFFIGSDDMLALFSQKQYGLNVYFGGFVPFGNRKPKDRDHDKVSDRRDRCPDEFGEWANHGCPLSDTAASAKGREKKVDRDDECPETEGLDFSFWDNNDTFQGNKDTDGDGIPDAEDACPTVAGVASNHGCPEGQPLQKDLVNLKKATVNWKEGKQPFTANDYVVFDRYATLLKEYPQYNLLIESYTDDRGTRAKNIALASKKAAIVKAYLVKKGTPAQRISIHPEGAHYPVAATTTPEGRAKNCRVVLELKQ